MFALKPLLNSSKPVSAACTNAVVASLVELSPELGVIAKPKPEASLASNHSLLELNSFIIKLDAKKNH